MYSFLCHIKLNHQVCENWFTTFNWQTNQPKHSFVLQSLWTDSLLHYVGKLLLYIKFIKHNQINLPKMTFQPLSEAFIRRSWYSVLPDLDMTGRCHVKKVVVGVTELIAALSRFIACRPSLQICTASLIHLEKCSDSLSISSVVCVLLLLLFWIILLWCC